MKLVKITSNKDCSLIQVECPNCDAWEEQDEWTPRRKLQMFILEEWYPDKADENEKSLMECTQCKTKFNLEWDYDNKESK